MTRRSLTLAWLSALVAGWLAFLSVTAPVATVAGDERGEHEPGAEPGTETREASAEDLVPAGPRATGSSPRADLRSRAAPSLRPRSRARLAAATPACSSHQHPAKLSVRRLI